MSLRVFFGEGTAKETGRMHLYDMDDAMLALEKNGEGEIEIVVSPDPTMASRVATRRWLMFAPVAFAVLCGLEGQYVDAAAFCTFAVLANHLFASSPTRSELEFGTDLLARLRPSGGWH